MKFPPKLLNGLIGLLLAAMVFAVFWPVLNCGFVNYDDPSYITSNAEVKSGLTWHGVAWAFTTGAASNWHPLTWLSHMADVSCYGTDPRGHHFTNVLLHAINTVLLFFILKNLTNAVGKSAMVAALFAVHPLHVESVAWISERKDVLSGLFWMLTIGMYVRYTKGRKMGYALSLLFFALGLMSKPMLVTAPFLMLLLDYWPLRRLEKNRVGQMLLEKVPFFVLAAISSIITVIVQRKGGAVTSILALPFGQRLANAFVSYVRYLGKTVWPVDLAILYPHPRHWPAGEVAGAILLLTAMTGWTISRVTRQPWLMVGWLWFLGMLVPVIGLVQVGIQSMADRYVYLPIVGIFIMFAWGACEWLGNRVGLALGMLALAACVVLTPRQVKYWADSETLFKHAAAVTTDNYLAYNNIGFFLSNRGQIEEAMKYYKSSLQINPNYEEAHNNLGFALAGLGRNKEAIDEYVKALSIRRDLTEAHNNLGNALAAVGQSGEAMHEYLVALEENPHYAQAHNNYGIALAMHGKVDDAIEQFHQAIRDDPDYLSAHSDLGNALAMQGKWSEALEQYRLCLKIDPNDPQVHNNLGNVLAQQNRLDEAVDQYRTALKLKPQNPEAHFNLGYCLARLGRRAEAAEECRAALAQRPDYPEARNELNLLQNAPK